ncbi:uncharacterized protein LOC142335134 [Convolutriloba macropyga]|uniref:uncharacterized protein LOC142335134 n=1 Tax=Convolutriloba macropyga TaxID=536237 RepID=UPI003F5216D9
MAVFAICIAIIAFQALKQKICGKKSKNQDESEGDYMDFINGYHRSWDEAGARDYLRSKRDNHQMQNRFNRALSSKRTVRQSSETNFSNETPNQPSPINHDTAGIMRSSFEQTPVIEYHQPRSPTRSSNSDVERNSADYINPPTPDIVETPHPLSARTPDPSDDRSPSRTILGD